MSLGKIIVETSQLDVVAQKVEGLANDYNAEYTALYNAVSEMQASWAGADNTAYTTQIQGFKDDFQKMEQIMRDYAEFLRDSAKKYRATQSDIKTKAQQLATNA